MKSTKNFFIILLALLFAAITFNLSAHTLAEDTATFKVYGNCGMCKKRIETALSKNKEIKKATWDVKTKMLTVVYDPKKITLDAIHKIVADVGHDTDRVKAKDATYNKLMDCCQYERVKS